MLIDWFTVGAQTLNFLLLVWLMQRFLYKPVLRAIDARAKRIAASLAEADQKMAEAQKEHDEFRRRNEEFDRQRATLLDQMTDEVEAKRSRLLNEARQAADELNSKQMEALRTEARNLRLAISRKAQQEVFDIARKTLSDLASVSLEERMTDAFIRHLVALSDVDKAELKTAFKDEAGTAVVRSAFPLPMSQQAAITSAFTDILKADIPLRFETAKDLVSGIDLTANGRKISWNIAAYLQSLETGLFDLLDGKMNPDESGVTITEEPIPEKSNS